MRAWILSMAVLAGCGSGLPPGGASELLDAVGPHAGGDAAAGDAAGTADTPPDAGNKCTANACPQSGACAWTSKGCEAVSDADCLASKVCKQFGFCGVTTASRAGIGVCRPLTDAHCAQSDSCKEVKFCVLWNGQCMKAAEAADQCAAECATRWPGKVCAAKNGVCGPTQ